MSEIIKQSAKDATEWYSINRPKYESLCLKVKLLLEEILYEEYIPYSSITCRAKE